MSLFHTFLKWFPTALFMAATIIAGLWPKARDWIAEWFMWGLSQMSDPWIFIAAILMVAAYVAAIVVTGRSPKRKGKPVKGRPDHEFNLSGRSVFAGNAVQGTTRLNADGSESIILDNEFGPNAQIRGKPKPKTEMEKRIFLVEQLLSEWVLTPESEGKLPFRDIDAMYDTTSGFINKRLSDHGVEWRLTDENRKDLGF